MISVLIPQIHLNFGQKACCAKSIVQTQCYAETAQMTKIQTMQFSFTSKYGHQLVPIFATGRQQCINAFRRMLTWRPNIVKIIFHM